MASPTPEQLAALIRFAAAKMGMTPDALLDAVQSGRTDALAGKMPGLEALLNDPARAQQLLNDPAARQLFERFLGGG